MTSTRRWQIPLAIVLAVYAAATWLLMSLLPLKDGARDWYAPLIKSGWMAWSFPSAMFFLTIALFLSLMAVWEYASPGGNPRGGSCASRRRAATASSFRCSAAPSSISLGWV